MLHQVFLKMTLQLLINFNINFHDAIEIIFMSSLCNCSVCKCLAPNSVLVRGIVCVAPGVVDVVASPTSKINQ